MCNLHCFVFRYTLCSIIDVRTHTHTHQKQMETSNSTTIRLFGYGMGALFFYGVVMCILAKKIQKSAFNDSTNIRSYDFDLCFFCCLFIVYSALSPYTETFSAGQQPLRLAIFGTPLLFISVMLEKLCPLSGEKRNEKILGISLGTI